MWELSLRGSYRSLGMLRSFQEWELSLRGSYRSLEWHRPSPEDGERELPLLGSYRCRGIGFSLLLIEDGSCRCGIASAPSARLVVCVGSSRGWELSLRCSFRSYNIG